MTINVNNHRTINLVPTDFGLRVEHRDEYGKIEWTNGYSEGEIVMALNLFNYMRENDMRAVYLPDNGSFERFLILD